MFDVIVVGAGSAGLSAALVLGRASRNTLVLDGGPPRNAPSPASHSFFTRDGDSPLELLRIGREQLVTYSTVRLRQARAVDACRSEDAFEVSLDDGSVHTARRIILATSVTDELPRIEGIDSLWGKGVYHCPFCHGYEVHDQPLALLVSGEPTAAFARLILGWSRDLIICSNGPAELDADQRDFLARYRIDVREEPIARLEGHDDGVRVVFEDGSALERSGLFVRPVQHQASDLARRLGCELADDDTVPVGEDGQTSVAGVYAAGDMTTPARQVIFAAASGARAAIRLQLELLAEDFV